MVYLPASTIPACACIKIKNDDTSKPTANFFKKNTIMKNTI